MLVAVSFSATDKLIGYSEAVLLGVGPEYSQSTELSNSEGTELYGKGPNPAGLRQETRRNPVGVAIFRETPSPGWPRSAATLGCVT